MQNNNNKVALFFALLGLMGAFFAKGANEPFGFINVFLFEHVPGMQMFRDPTKWYLFISFAYAMLIPFSLSQLTKVVNEKFKTQKSNLPLNIKNYSLVIVFIIFWLALIYPALSKINDLFSPHPIPQSYVQLKDFLNDDKRFSRTLWLPKWQRYGYFSFTHPAIGRGELVKEGSPSAMIANLQEEKMKERLRLFDVQYIIVPEDSEEKSFWMMGGITKRSIKRQFPL